ETHQGNLIGMQGSLAMEGWSFLRRWLAA
ncbi:hypothetical protein S1OALGB6SA_264, partial [Olavius algarvensis spirochete endosymbiont]